MLINNLARWAVDNKRTQEMSDAAYAAGVTGHCFSCKRWCVAGCGSESPTVFGPDSTYDPQHYPYQAGEENGRKNSAIVEFTSDFC